MMQPEIYANFDLNFPGATIICDSEEKREVLLKYLNGKSTSIDLPLTYEDDEEDFRRAIFNTTYIHEGKHLHDHLLCPLLLRNYTLKLAALCYSSLAIHEWEKGVHPFKVLPLPFTSWISLPYQKKLELIERKHISSSDVPMYSLQDAFKVNTGEIEGENIFSFNLLAAALGYYQYEYNVLQNSPDGYNTELSVRTFTEAMAYVQQVIEMELRHGTYGTYLHNKIRSISFKHFMKLGSMKRDKNINITSDDYIGYCTYTAAFTMVYRYAVQRNINPNYIYLFIAYVLFWALSGNVYSDDKMYAVFPRNRLERLLNLDRMGVNLKLNEELNIRNLFDDPLGTYNKWDHLISETYRGTKMHIESQGELFNIDVESTPTNFELTYKTTIGILNDLSDRLYSVGYNETADYIDNINLAIFLMSSNGFLKYPSSYLNPISYSENLSNFINVPFKIIFKKVNPITKEECPNLRENVEIVHDSIYGDSLMQENKISDKIKLDWRKYVNASKYILFADALLGNAKVDQPGKIVKELLPGIRTCFF